MTFNFEEKYKNVLPAGFFIEMNKSKTAKKMAQIFMDHGCILQLVGGNGGAVAQEQDGTPVVYLGKEASSCSMVVSFCHEVVHCLQSHPKVLISDLKQMSLCPQASAEFRERQTALLLYYEIAAYNMTRRILKELGQPFKTIEEYLYNTKLQMGTGRVCFSYIDFYRSSLSQEKIKSRLDYMPGSYAYIA